MSIKLKQVLKRGIKTLLASYGYFIARLDASPHTMDGAFRSILQRKHSFNTVIDVGASDGRWTDALMKYFPLCSISTDRSSADPRKKP